MKLIVKLIEPPALKLICYLPSGEKFALPTVRTHNPKIQLQILSAALKRLSDVEVELIDMKIGEKEIFYKTINYEGVKIECFRLGSDFKDIRDKIKEADVIGITSTFTQTSGVVFRLGQYIKKKNPWVELITGGFDTATEERKNHYLKNGFDLVIPTDGEVHLFNYLKKKYHLDCPLNKGKKTKIRIGDYSINRLVLPLPDLEAVNLDLYTEIEDGPLPKGAKLPIGYFISSKGCNNLCNFCTVPLINGSFKLMSLKDIEKLLKHYRRYGITTLLHAESNTLGRLWFGEKGRELLIKTFNLFRRYGFAWEFFDGIEFGRLLKENGEVDQELVELLFKPEIKEGVLIGGYRAYIPLEDLAIRGSSRYRKIPTYQKQKTILKTIIKSGVKSLSFGVIIGYPDETRSSLEEKKKTLKRLKDWVTKTSKGKTSALFIIYIHSTFPGSLDYRQFKDQLKYDIEKDPELFQLYTACKASKELSPLELTLLRRELDRELNGADVADISEKTGRPPVIVD